MTSRKGSFRRGFFARLVGLTALPFVAKVAAALSAEGPRALGGTETSIDHHPLTDYYFFWIDRGELYVGGAKTIAVRKNDGRVTHCGLVGE